jgi:DNA-dependent RNA polymerase auxiliary subunit epsilon
MPIRFDYETDTLYLKGAEKGIVQGIEKKNSVFVRNLLLTTDFSNERIALLADVTVEYVQKARLELKL